MEKGPADAGPFSCCCDDYFVDDHGNWFVPLPLPPPQFLSWATIVDCSSISGAIQILLICN